MENKEQHLASIKTQKNLELETTFNNLVNSGLVVKYGADRTEDIHVVGGRPTLFSLKAFLAYYVRISSTACYIRDPITNTTHVDTIQNLEAMVNDVETWGMENYIKNIIKQDYVKQCTTIDQVLDVTWDSIDS